MSKLPPYKVASPCWKHGAVLGVDVDHACGAKTELRRKRTGNQRDAIGKTGFEFLAETRNTFRQEHVVDPILQVGVFAADVNLAE